MPHARQGPQKEENMPRTKKPPPELTPAPVPSAVNGLASEVLTLSEAAAYLRLAEADVIGLIHTQGLPARFIVGQWRFLKSAIQQWLSTGSPTAQSRKEAQLALAGKYKDDPDLTRICEDALRQRGRPMTEGD
jgi:excisionase family DNA binding protein